MIKMWKTEDSNHSYEKLLSLTCCPDPNQSSDPYTVDWRGDQTYLRKNSAMLPRSIKYIYFPIFTKGPLTFTWLAVPWGKKHININACVQGLLDIWSELTLMPREPKYHHAPIKNGVFSGQVIHGFLSHVCVTVNSVCLPGLQSTLWLISTLPECTPEMDILSYRQTCQIVSEICD